MSYSADLQTGLVSSKEIRVEKNLITYDDKKINPEEVACYNYEKIRFRIQGILSVQYKINLIDKNGTEFKIHFGCGGLNEDNMDKHYLRILKEFRLLFGLRLLNELYAGLIEGKEFSFNKYLKAIPQGICLVQTHLFSKTEIKTIKWEDIDYTITNQGALFVKGLGEEKAERNIVFSINNISILHALLNYLHEDSDRIAVIYSANKISF